MHEIAEAAGCSRATLYRYFENREALHTAYVHREAYRCTAEMIEQHSRRSTIRASGWSQGILASLDLVRDSPALQSWFATGDAPIGAEIAEQSDVIKALAPAFVVSLGPPTTRPPSSARPAGWCG